MIGFIHDALFIVIMVILGNDIFQVVHRVMIGTRRNFVFLVYLLVTFLIIFILYIYVYFVSPPFLSNLLFVTCDGFKTMGEDTWTF